MAYTKAPINDTYSTQRISLAYPLHLRPGNQNYQFNLPYQVQDEGMVNAFLVAQEGSDPMAQTRPGLNGSYINNTSNNSLVRGMYVWEKTPGAFNYFIVCGVSVYGCTSNPLVGTNWTLINTLTTSATSPVRFTEFIDATNVKKLVMVDGVEGYVYTSAAAAGTKITDADFPTPHVPWPVFLNGRLYLAKSGTGDIYNSNLNDPAAWTAGEYISTEVYPDDIQAIVKVDNYLLAIGTQSCEYFFDAANATGSPLARYEGQTLPFGTLFPNSIAVNKDTVVVLANTNDGQSVFKVINKFTAGTIDSSGIVPTYNRMLNNPALGWAITYSQCRGNFFRANGELYYGFLFNGETLGVYQAANVSYCFAFSFKTKTWTELQYGDSVTNREDRYAFPMFVTASNTTGSLTTYVAGNARATSTAFFAKLDDLIGYDTITSLTNYQIYQEFRTPNMDFGTINRKFMNRLAVVSEVYDSSLNPQYYISWNDFEFSPYTWTTALTTTSTSVATNTNTDYWPFVTQLGWFRRRALRIVCVTGKPMTTRYMEVNINKGLQ